MTIDPPEGDSESGFGWSMAQIPDLDGDGANELVVSAITMSIPGLPAYSGAVYVFSGRTGVLIRRLRSPNPMSYAYFGAPVAGIGDLDADGVPEILVGESGQNRAYVFSGADGTLFRTLISGDPAGAIFFGSSVVALPDINGDGKPDIAVGAPGEDHEHGRVYLYSGATGAILRTLVSPSPRPGAGGDFGSDIAAVPDADGDGLGDVLVGAPNEYPPGRTDDRGRAHLFSGATGLLIRSIDSPIIPSDHFGEQVVGLPDIDGDRRADYAVASTLQPQPGCSTCQGAVYVYSGASGTLLYTLTSPLHQGGPFGRALSGALDLEGGGRTGLVIGAANNYLPGQPLGTGVVYVFSGATGSLIRLIPSQHVTLPPHTNYFGATLTVLNDANGDHRPDLAIFASGCATQCPPNAFGRIYIFMSCAADYNYSGSVTSQDFFDFLTAFFTGLPGADFNRDGTADTRDFLDFLAAFFGGC